MKTYMVRGKKLTAKEWKSLVQTELEQCIKYNDEIAWENDSILQNEQSSEYRIYYTLHIGKG